MKSTKQIVLGCFFIIITLLNGKSQTIHKPQKTMEASPIGWGVNLGNISFFNRTFQFGLAPNVAYRIGESLAFGFMLKADYYYEKFPDQQAKFSAFDFGPTIFTRLKPLWGWDSATPFLKGIFLQAEYERGFLTRYFAYRDLNGFLVPIIEDGKVKRDKFQEDFIYVGIGATTGYPFSTFVSIHYNLLDDFDSARMPFSYRIGFTYNY